MKRLLKRIMRFALPTLKRLGVAPTLERYGLYHPPGFGLNGLDKKMLRHINWRKGIFIEAGANNGLRQSNTAYLEFWRG